MKPSLDDFLTRIQIKTGMTILLAENNQIINFWGNVEVGECYLHATISKELQRLQKEKGILWEKEKSCPILAVAKEEIPVMNGCFAAYSLENENLLIFLKHQKNSFSEEEKEFLKTSFYLLTKYFI